MATKRAPPQQLPMWDPESNWRPPRISDLPSWEGAKRIGYDVETFDPDLKPLGCGSRRSGSFLAGFSFAIEDGPEFYVPLAHGGGDNVENPEMALRYLADQAKVFRGILVGANMPYDLDWSAENSVDFLGNREITFRDVQVADPLLNELQYSYSLEAILQRWGLPGKDEELLEEAARHYGVDPKGGLAKLPARFVGPYASTDARRPLQVLRRQEKAIEDNDLWDIFNLESAVLPVLVKMRRRGVRIDQDRLEAVDLWSLSQENEALGKVYDLTGVRIKVGDVWQAGALAPALEAIGIDLPKTAKGDISITKELLASIDHPVAQSLAWARKTNKLRTTFAASIRKYMVNGRIHATFNQLRKTRDAAEGGDDVGAAYGRLSSENPNIQQQPARDEFAARWRSIYLPEEGATWFCNDYSQQEPRWVVHFAERLGLDGARDAADRYRHDPSTDNHAMMTELMHGAEAVAAMKVDGTFKKERDHCKQTFLGKLYGMGGAKLCRQYNLPTRWAVFYADRRPAVYSDSPLDAKQIASNTGGRAWEVAGLEGQAIIDKFDERLPFVKALAKQASRVAARRGNIRTVGGRLCRFPVSPEGGYDWTHKALNRLIQGSSADQMKKAMVEADAAGHFIQLQVHDEVDGSCSGEAQARELAEIMAGAYPATVPFKIDIELGPSWGELKGV